MLVELTWWSSAIDRASSAIERCSSSTITTASRWNSGGCFDGRPLGPFSWTWTSSYRGVPQRGDGRASIRTSPTVEAISEHTPGQPVRSTRGQRAFRGK